MIATHNNPKQSAPNGFEEFFFRCQQKIDNLTRNDGNTRKDRIKNIKKWIKEAIVFIDHQRANDADKRTKGLHFNIFTIVKIERYEVKTHTPFIASLLDVNGSHGQGNIFLQYFLSEVLNIADSKNIVDNNNWIVESERRRPGLDGQFDILLSSYSAGIVALIENKVFAVDQWKQLERYWFWLENSWPENFRNKRLIYLTLDGKEPPHGKHKAERKSYRVDVKTWLESAARKIKAPRVTEIIGQYLDTIPYLRGDI